MHRPALVSLQRNRGIADYLPGHDQFDHVITRLQLDGKVYWLDPTLQKQGRRLDTRGHSSYGIALVVRAAGAARWPRWSRPPGALEGMEFDQTWDVSDIARAAQFTSVIRAAWPGRRRRGATPWPPAAPSAWPRTWPAPGHA